MLHIIKSVAALDDAMALYSEQDDVLLIEDAVYAANPQHKAFSKVKDYQCLRYKAILKPAA